MNGPGGTEDLLAQSRSALIDALQALDAHRDAVIVVARKPSTSEPPARLLPWRKRQRTASLSSTPVVFTMTLS